MRFCTSCGHQLGTGRFCTNCGLRVEHPASDHEEWRTDTAERPAVPAQPPAPRFPLYADELARTGAHNAAAHHPSDAPVSSTPSSHATGASAASAATAATAATAAEELVPMGAPFAPRAQPRPTRRQWKLFAVLVGIATVWILVAVAGAVLLVRADHHDSRDSAADPARTSTGPTRKATGHPTQPPKHHRPAPLRDVARLATARAPSIAPPSVDVDGAAVTYGPQHMLDHDHTTCWRMPGDGTGRTIIFTLRGRTELTRVGLVNGYAKTATDAYGNELDSYAGDRRILTVQWEFDDGTTVEQQLREVPHLQTIKVPDVATSTVRLKLITVSSPGDGVAASDDTAISEISLVGRAV